MKFKKKIVALMIGKKTSYGIPGKNIFKIHKKHLFEYPIISAIKSKRIDKLYISTDCPTIKKVSKKYKATIIERPKNIQSPKTLTEDVLEHAHNYIKKDIGGIDNIKYYVLLYANGAFLNISTVLAFFGLYCPLADILTNVSKSPLNVGHLLSKFKISVCKLSYLIM